MPAITSIGQSVPLSGISNADYPASGTTLYDSRFENVRWKVDDHTTIIFNLLSVVLLSDIHNGLDFYYQFKVVSNPILYRPEPRPIRRPSLAFPFTWLAGYDTRILFAPARAVVGRRACRRRLCATGACQVELSAAAVSPRGGRWRGAAGDAQGRRG